MIENENIEQPPKESTCSQVGVERIVSWFDPNICMPSGEWDECMIEVKYGDDEERAIFFGRYTGEKWMGIMPWGGVDDNSLDFEDIFGEVMLWTKVDDLVS